MNEVLADMLTNMHAELAAKTNKASNLLAAALTGSTIQVWIDTLGFRGWVDLTPELVNEDLKKIDINNFRVKESK